MKRLLVTVLSMEAVVCLLAIVPAKQLGHASVGTASAVCGAVALVAFLLCGYVGRGRTGLYVGSVFQAAVIATGVILPEMYAIGAIFAALWFTGIWLGRKWEGPEAEARQAAAREAAGQQAASAAAPAAPATPESAPATPESAPATPESAPESAAQPATREADGQPAVQPAGPPAGPDEPPHPPAAARS